MNTSLRAQRKAAAVAVFGMMLLTASCSAPRPPLFPGIVPGQPPPPDSVDAVLLLIGDAGEAVAETAPLLARLKQEVEVWSELLGRDSAVTVLFLGDNVYPSGVHDRTHPDFPRDSSIIWGQIEVLSGPKARSRGALGYFLAGNHDWGNKAGEAGLRRLQNMEEQIQLARKAGIPVQLAPPAGAVGPSVRDLRENMRLMMIDTHLFLQEPSPAARYNFIAGIENAIKEAGDRHVLIASHHPFASAGPHGQVLVPVTKALGIIYLLQKSGTLVQDMNSPVYSELRGQLKEAFARTRPPLAFIGGHDHSLQVHVGKDAADPRYIIVSGAGSKNTTLAGADSMRYGTSRPGFMSLVFRKQGAVDLFVIAGRGTETAEECPPVQEAPECVAVEKDAYSVVYSERLAFVTPPKVDTLSRDTAAVKRAAGGLHQ